MSGDPLERPLAADALGAARDLVAADRDLASALESIRDDSDRAAAAYRGVVRSLAIALAARDGYTGAHSDIVHDLAVAVAERLGLAEEAVEEVRAVAVLHDIGKIGVPDGILHKPGPLDPDEWELMRTHPIIGERILQPLAGFAGVARAVRHEHERWDGQGYPDGIAGAAIPQASRIVLACDAYHALVSDRPYRAALTPAAAMRELRAGAGSQFDPEVIDALLGILEAGAVPLERRSEEVGQLAVSPSRAAREARALLAIASASVAADELPALLGVIADEAFSALDVSSVSVAKFEADFRMLRVVVNAGLLNEWEARHPVNALYRVYDDDPRRETLVRGVALAVDRDTGPQHPELQRLLERLGRQSLLLVPVVIGGVVWGELLVTRTRELPEFDEAALRFLRTLAGQIGIAVTRVELFAQMADLAFRDPLTGVGNRRAFDERLEHAVRDALAAGSELALVLCDLDNLRDLNEVGGHPAGDDALVHVASVLGEAAGGERVYRLGGDEFAVLLEGDALTGRLFGEQVLAGLREGVSVSCGVAGLGLLTRAADLLRAADHAQYAAKRAGRARVCVATPDPELAWPDRVSGRELRERRVGQRRTVDLARLLERSLAVLDGPLLGAAAQERLEAVIAVAAPALDLARSALSRTMEGSGRLEAIATNDYRSGHMWALGLGGIAEGYELADFPATARIVAQERSFFVDAGDMEADGEELRLLHEWGLDAVVAAAARRGDETWVVELYGDRSTTSLAEAEGALRLLVSEAVVRGAAGGAAESRAA